jgi:hypothetical protein
MLGRGKCINFTLKLYKSRFLRKSQTHDTFNFYLAKESSIKEVATCLTNEEGAKQKGQTLTRHCIYQNQQ